MTIGFSEQLLFRSRLERIGAAFVFGRRPQHSRLSQPDVCCPDESEAEDAENRKRMRTPMEEADSDAIGHRSANWLRWGVAAVKTNNLWSLSHPRRNGAWRIQRRHRRKGIDLHCVSLPAAVTR